MRLITRDYGSEARQNERQLSRKYVCQVFSAFHAASEERMGEGWGGRLSYYSIAMRLGVTVHSVVARTSKIRQNSDKEKTHVQCKSSQNSIN